ncbi:terminase family protein [Arcticibacter pallidicorallinus]|uniref:Terminase family protein n=1 Tax=Arcticibacter pallidicorallinus TaxID=1259464 RepID=A0A2T0U0P1_9SPHI|nr:phage terminase large subunit [Arcticibacter pallidicorallinus]PRY51516.1 terminase family protein [Arcticibacter pallidicorallinus]
MIELESLLNVDDMEINLEFFRRRAFDFITVNENGELQRKHLKQEAALFALTDDVTSELIYGGAAGGAKSWTGCAWLAFSCMAYPGTKYFIGRAELMKIKESTLVTFRRVCKTYGILEGRDWRYYTTDHYIEFTNGSRINLIELKFKPSEDPQFERLGSTEYTSGWIEEGGEVHFRAFDVLKSRVNRMLNDQYGLIGKIFVTCNPKKNWLYTQFYKPAKKNLLKFYQKFIQALVEDNVFAESGYIEQLRRMSDLAMKERLFKGNWDYDNDPAALMEYTQIVDIFRNDHVEPTGIRYITADIARLGDDYTRIYLWDGLVNTKRISLYKQRAPEVIKAIKDLAAANGVPMSRVVVDADGVGGPIADFLKNCNEMNNQSTAFPSKETGVKENFKNKRSQLYTKLSQMVINAAIRIIGADPEEEDDISTELSVIKKINMDSDGPVDIISRKDIKELIGRSPDHATNLMLRMWFEYKVTRAPKYSF